MPQAGSSNYSGPVLKIGFLWHQHQPYYKDLLTGEYILPWVRLHGVKDYLDMVEILDNHPSIKQTFNMVPSLLEQLEDYAGGNALDRHLALSLRKAEELSLDEKGEMLETHFQAQYDNMIGPSPRYAYLYHNRQRAIDTWTATEWRDLQTLANIAWIDPIFKLSGRLKDLASKGERYTENEKQEILIAQREIISKIVPSLRKHLDTGQIEISVTPYFHPIMPLLYDTSSALIAMPGAAMPKNRFQHPEDVAWHVEQAVKYYEKLFGQKPTGMWPSEGSVSEDIIPILAKYGIKWIATDEEILAESLGVPDRTDDSNSLITSGQLYRAYRFEKKGAQMSLFFRDHALSDNIGFVYSGWDSEKAADDFISKLGAIHQNLLAKRIENPIVPIILDGENAWEYYKNDGHDFLEALYNKIESSQWLETVTFNQYLNGKPSQGELKKLFPGSWISHNFAVWIGHAEDNKAWDMVFKTRDEFMAFRSGSPNFDKDKLELAWKELMISEGSDWCWWFGEDHVGPNNDDFDRLFRAHLANVYRLTDREPPSELFLPVRSSFIDAHFFKPVDFIKPVIDGKLTHFYEWQQAGYFDCAKAGSTMHKAERMLFGIWFGFDDKNLYFRIDPSVTVSRKRFESLIFSFEFLDSTKLVIDITPHVGLADLNERISSDIKCAYKDFLEISMPLSLFSAAQSTTLLTRLTIKEDGKAVEVWPPSDALKIELPSSHDIPWTV